MSEAESESRFKVTLEFTDDELKAYQAVAKEARQSFAHPHWFAIAMAVATALSFVGTWIAIAAGVATSHGSGVIVLVIFVAFWAGLYMPYFLVSSRAHRQYRNSFRTIWQGSILQVSPNGFALKRPSAYGVYRRPAITAVTQSRGLILIWTSALSPFALPARLLTPKQRAMLMSLARSGENKLPAGSQIQETSA